MPFRYIPYCCYYFIAVGWKVACYIIYKYINIRSSWKNIFSHNSWIIFLLIQMNACMWACSYTYIESFHELCRFFFFFLILQLDKMNDTVIYNYWAITFINNNLNFHQHTTRISIYTIIIYFQKLKSLIVFSWGLFHL